MNSAVAEVGKVANTAVDAMRAQPGLLFLTIVNVAFLVFTYFIGTLALDAYNQQQDQMNERYQMALKTVNRCIDTAFSDMEMRAERNREKLRMQREEQRQRLQSTDQMRGEKPQ